MKRLIVSAIVSLVLNAAAFVTNLVSWGKTHHLPLALRRHGGEITVEQGFGLRGVHIYAMTPQEADAHSLGFDPVSMVLCLLAGIAVVYLILFIAGKILKK